MMEIFTKDAFWFMFTKSFHELCRNMFTYSRKLSRMNIRDCRQVEISRFQRTFVIEQRKQEI